MRWDTPATSGNGRGATGHETIERKGPRAVRATIHIIGRMALKSGDRAGYDQSDPWVGIGYARWLISFVIDMAITPGA